VKDRCVVIGIGNPYRRDDGVGGAVIALLRDIGPHEVAYVELDGEPTRLIDAWDEADLAVVVDACQSGGASGEIHLIDLDSSDLPIRPAALSGHSSGLRDAIELGRALDRMPGCLRVIAVEGADFAAGEQMSPSVTAAVPRAARAVLAELALRNS
jgi:hydrogenase maturation protease